MRTPARVTAVTLSLLALLVSACATGAAAPVTREFQVMLGEGEIIGEVEKAGKTVDEVIGEYHRWEPGTLVAFVGDKVRITVTNPRKHVHGFAIPALNVETPPLEPRVGKHMLEFVVDRAGIYVFACNQKFDEAKATCDSDHASMTGHLIVLAR